MSAIAVTPVYNTFLDVDGNPVDDGYVWIGQPNLDPIANPQNAYWDEALTQLVTQPVRTRQGYPLNGSSVGKLYVAGSYSILVRNENGSDVIGAATFSADDVIDNLDLTGDLTFTGTGQRIRGDMSNATVANRLMFQTSTVNGPTIAAVIPNGTGVVARFQGFNSSDPNNASFADIGANATEAQIRSGQTGTGTYLPMTFYTGGSERVRVDTSGNVGIGTASPGAILHTVKTSAGAATVGAFIQNADNTTSTEVRLAFAANSALLSADRYGWIGYVNTGGTNGGALTFATTPGGTAATERLRIDSSGNINIATAGARITGDFSNATLASRVYFQSSTTNGNTGIGALPNGTATTATFTVFNTSDPANSSVGQLAATSTDIRAVSSVTGTGSAVPFKVFVGGGEQVRIGGDSTLRSLGSFAVNTPPLINAATYTTLGTDFSLRFSTTNCTITLPAAATYPGRILIITNVTANSVTSDASNVKPLGSDVAGTTILSASAGKFAFLQSDGSFWITLMAN